MASPRVIHVPLGTRSYDVTVAGGLLDSVGERIAPLARGGRAVIITDSNVGPLYGTRVAAALSAAGLAVDTIDFPPERPASAWPPTAT